MRYVRALSGAHGLKCAAMMTAILFAGLSCAGQNAQMPATQDTTGLRALSKNPELSAELGKLAGRMQREVSLPAPRHRSDLLPLLPESTMFYVALPNYGEAAHQALAIFEQEVQTSSVLREWWQQVEPVSRQPKMEDLIEKFYQVSRYFGDEVVLSGATGGTQSKVLIVAQVRKPGLKDALQEVLRELAPKSNPSVRVLDPRELAAAGNVSPAPQFLVLVRPDVVAASSDLDTLRSFNAHLESGERNFASGAFGQRVTEEYEGGATIVGGADLQRILSQIPHGTAQGQEAFHLSGFAEMKYVVWAQKRAGDALVGSGELSFTGPRHGIASWLAAPGPIESLSYASPGAMIVSSVRLKSPAEMFEDVRAIAAATNPNAFAALGAFEQMFGFSLKDDLLGQLTGETTLELDSITPKPEWKTILGVKDSAHLQQTLNKLFTAMHVITGELEEGGITYHTVTVPSGRTATAISFAFVPGYMIVAVSHDAIADAVRRHGSGESLGKSAKFMASLPAGHPSGVSALMYQDPMAMATLQLRETSPELASALLRMAGGGKPMLACAYGDDASIRAATTNPGMDAGAIGIVAAIAIPNVLRSKASANEASAVGTMRSVVTAEAAYASIYPYRGYAPDLATLGTNPSGAGHTADHAALLDATVANPSCTAGAWCTKSGFRFTLTGTCRGEKCSEFVVLATPVADSAGTKSFCATSDGVIHFKAGAPLESPVSTSACRAWAPIQ